MTRPDSIQKLGASTIMLRTPGTSADMTAGIDNDATR